MSFAVKAGEGEKILEQSGFVVETDTAGNVSLAVPAMGFVLQLPARLAWVLGRAIIKAALKAVKQRRPASRIITLGR